MKIISMTMKRIGGKWSYHFLFDYHGSKVEMIGNGWPFGRVF